MGQRRGVDGQHAAFGVDHRALEMRIATHCQIDRIRGNDGRLVLGPGAVAAADGQGCSVLLTYVDM